MVGWATAYWMGLNAAENARLDRQMWDLAGRAAGRQQAPVYDGAALTDQVAQLQVQLQHALADANALRVQCKVNYDAWAAEKALREKADFLVGLARSALDENDPINWHLP
jgi:hypothetical protein